MGKRLAFLAVLASVVLGCGPNPQPTPSASSEAETPFKLAQYQSGGSRHLAMEIGGRLHDLHRLESARAASLPGS